MNKLNKLKFDANFIPNIDALITVMSKLDITEKEIIVYIRDNHNGEELLNRARELKEDEFSFKIERALDILAFQEIPCIAGLSKEPVNIDAIRDAYTLNELCSIKRLLPSCCDYTDEEKTDMLKALDLAIYYKLEEQINSCMEQDPKDILNSLISSNSRKNRLLILRYARMVLHSKEKNVKKLA